MAITASILPNNDIKLSILNLKIENNIAFYQNGWYNEFVKRKFQYGEDFK
ncbi:hypothetical protein [uncultured Mitsuokella sp.]|nr:hypothetical protein [uncultured Mitsuokella sp.]